MVNLGVTLRNKEEQVFSAIPHGDLNQILEDDYGGLSRKSKKGIG